MSFSSDVKKELCRIPIQKRCCALSQVYGVLLYANTFSPNEIRIITGNSDLAEKLPPLFKRAFGFSFDSCAPRSGTNSKTVFLLTESEKIKKVFQSFGYEAHTTVAHHINLGVLENDCCRTSFVRGAFLAGGSVTDPRKRYHLELVTDHMSVSRETYSILLDMGFSPKEAFRNGNYIIYFKLSEAIEDLLTCIGAPLSAMEIMNAKIEKDMRNTINRKVNCDTANADKIVNAAQQQLDAIRALDREFGLSNLPDKLQETALLRIANPEASISDLAALANPPVSKSCLSHRLRKLTNFNAAAFKAAERM